MGQVKPPVATREDIDNSGLQIIKSSDLPRLEEEGRVASNCVERVSHPGEPRDYLMLTPRFQCLICLEDYEADDDLRLMSCKHAYHKDCVDRWLQVGRNNCPACRTKVRPPPAILPLKILIFAIRAFPLPAIPRPHSCLVSSRSALYHKSST